MNTPCCKKTSLRRLPITYRVQRWVFFFFLRSRLHRPRYWVVLSTKPWTMPGDLRKWWQLTDDLPGKVCVHSPFSRRFRDARWTRSPQRARGFIQTACHIATVTCPPSSHLFSTFIRLRTNHSQASSSGYDAKRDGVTTVYPTHDRLAPDEWADPRVHPAIVQAAETSLPQYDKLDRRIFTHTKRNHNAFVMPNKEEKEDAQNLKLQHTHHSRCTGLYFCHKGGNFYHRWTGHTLLVGELQNAIGVLTHESFSLVFRFRLEIAILRIERTCPFVCSHSTFCILYNCKLKVGAFALHTITQWLQPSWTSTSQPFTRDV